jgi:succinylarginine dihydrolase
VISVGNGRFYLVHELALLDQQRTLDDLAAAVGPGFHAEIVRESEVSVADAVRTYLFNSQLVTLPGGDLVIAWQPGGTILMSGPATTSYRGTFDWDDYSAGAAG